MSSTPKYAHCDTTKPDGFYVQFERIVQCDDDADPRDYLFQDEDYREADQERLDAFNRGEWYMVGVRARAKGFIVYNGTGTAVNLDSAGVWGVESDSGDEYLNELYHEQVIELKAMIEAIHNPTYEEKE